MNLFHLLLIDGEHLVSLSQTLFVDEDSRSSRRRRTPQNPWSLVTMYTTWLADPLAFDRSPVTGPVHSGTVPFFYEAHSERVIEAGWLDIIISGVCYSGVVNLLYSTCILHVPTFQTLCVDPSALYILLREASDLIDDRSRIHGLFDNRSPKIPGEQDPVSLSALLVRMDYQLSVQHRTYIAFFVAHKKAQWSNGTGFAPHFPKRSSTSLPSTISPGSFDAPIWKL